AASGAVSTTTPARGPRGPADPSAPATRSRSIVTNRAASASEVPGSRQAYSAPAPAGPLTAGLTPASAPAAATASSTGPSELTQNDTRTTVTEPGSAPQRAGAVSATDITPPGKASSSDICLDRSATPGPVPSSSTPTRSG